MTRAPTPTFATLLEAAHQAADASGRAVLPFFRRPIAVDDKSAGAGFDPVTAADRAAERAILRLISKRFPDHGVIGEELGSLRGTARWRWIIDPIDGTRSFITGTPMWGTLIGLLDGADPVLGIMDQPFTGERFWSARTAAHARSADGRSRRIRTRACRRLADALVMTTSPDLFTGPGEQPAFERIKAEARMTRYGGDCYAYCLLASGWVDLVVEAGLQPYDVVALIPIIERAGGRITTWDGEPATSGGRIIASGDVKLHERVLKALAEEMR